MSNRWVVNASPLIVRCKIDHQSLLFDLTDELILPQAVADGIAPGPADDPARQFLAALSIFIVHVPSLPAVPAWDLGMGESAVLSYASANEGRTAVVDDGAARRCARALELPLVGTLRHRDSGSGSGSQHNPGRSFVKQSRICCISHSYWVRGRLPIEAEGRLREIKPGS